MATKQLEVQIMGQSYILGTPEGGQQQLLSAVEKVDAAMCRIRDAGKVKARDRIAVLAALNLAFELADPDKTGVASNELPAASHSAESPSVAANAQDGSHDPRLSALLQRLDNALVGDGQLI